MTKEKLLTFISDKFGGNQAEFVRKFNEASKSNLTTSYLNRQIKGNVSLEKGGYSAAYFLFENLFVIEQKALSIIENADNTLKAIADSDVAKKYANVTSNLQLDQEYYTGVAVYSWGERGKKIAIMELCSTIKN